MPEDSNENLKFLMKQQHEFAKRKNLMGYLTTPQLLRSIIKTSTFLYGKGKRGRLFGDIFRFLTYTYSTELDSKRLVSFTEKF